MKFYQSSKLRVWENLSLTLKEFKVKLLGYRSYVVSLRQTDTDPIEIIKEYDNTLGVKLVNSTYDALGSYILEFDKEIFDIDPTQNYINITPIGNAGSGLIAAASTSTTELIISSDGSDNIIGNGAITILEIRVYNQ